MRIPARFFPFLAWPRLDAPLLRGELLAGFVVGLMVLPQGMAYASLAGMPLVTGVYAAMLPALVAVLFSASTRVSAGPTAITCLLVFASLSGLAQPGSAQWIELAVWLALLSGVLQVAMGALRFGWLLNLVGSPVLMAFTQAAAVLIIGSQLPALLGLGAPLSEWRQLAAANLASAAFGLAALGVLVLSKRWRPTFPTVLVLLAGSALLSQWIGFEAAGGAVVGRVLGEMPALYLPSLPETDRLLGLLLPALMIALVSFLETAASAKADNDRRGQRWDRDQDLIGQGLAKIVAGASGAFPTSASFSRSALNLYAGARSGWATVFSVAVVVLVLLFLSPWLYHAPRAALAAIEIAAVLGLLQPMAFRRLWEVSRAEAMIALATFVTTLLTAPRIYWGVFAGVLMALAHFMHQRMHPRIVEVGLHPDGSLRDRRLWKLPPLAPEVYAVRMDAALDFATASTFERVVVEHLASNPHLRAMCLFAQPINRVDATGAEVFVKLCLQLRARGIALHLSGLKLPAEQTLRAAGAIGPQAWPQLHRTDAELLACLSQAAADRQAAVPAGQATSSSD